MTQRFYNLAIHYKYSTNEVMEMWNILSRKYHLWL